MGDACHARVEGTGLDGVPMAWVAGKEENMVRLGRRRRRLAFSVLLVAAGLMGCQAGPYPWRSIMDECGYPTPSNKDWCLSIQFPNTV